MEYNYFGINFFDSEVSMALVKNQTNRKKRRLINRVLLIPFSE